MVKIYTKTGDHGETGLYGGKRLPKYALEVEAIGDVDELNSVIGVIFSEGGGERLQSVQHRLFTIGANLAAVTKASGRERIPRLTGRDVLALESWIDEMEEGLQPLRQFILPGGSPLAAQCFFARAVCRRAERRVARLKIKYPDFDAVIPQYLNRLSDLLFVLARYINYRAGAMDAEWRK